MDDGLNSVGPPGDTVSGVDLGKSGKAAARDVAALRRNLRAKMAAVLSTQASWSRAHPEKERATARQSAVHALYKDYALPATGNEQTVRDFLTEKELRYRAYLEALESQSDAQDIVTEVLVQWYAATAELAAAIADATCPELEKDDVFLAAQVMRKQAPVPEKQPESQLVSRPETGKLNDEQLAYVSELVEVTRLAAIATARALKDGADVQAAVAEVNGSRRPSVSEPVRPTEEEVRRYLSQCEHGTLRKLAADRAVLPLLDRREQGLIDLAAAHQKLTELIRKGMTIIAHVDLRAESGPAYACAVAVSNLQNVARYAYGDGYERRWLDTIVKPSPSAREVRQMAELRKLMRQRAICLANRNEAQTALKAARNTPKEDDVLLMGVHCAHTWEEALAWRDDIDRKQEDVNSHNATRDAKLELLEESVKRFTRDVTDTTTTLRRYMLAVKPSESRPPCDELRALINAASYMVTPYRHDDESSKEGDYPVY